MLGDIVGFLVGVKDKLGLDVGFVVGRILGFVDGFLVGTGADEKIAQ